MAGWHEDFEDEPSPEEQSDYLDWLDRRQLEEDERNEEQE